MSKYSRFKLILIDVILAAGSLDVETLMPIAPASQLKISNEDKLRARESPMPETDLFILSRFSTLKCCRCADFEAFRYSHAACWWKLFNISPIKHSEQQQTALKHYIGFQANYIKRYL